MSTTPNFDLPLITDSMTADVPRDMDALAMAADAKISTAFKDVKAQDALLTQKGITSLSNAIDSDSEKEAATPKAIQGASNYIDAQVAFGKASLVQKGKKDLPGLQREVANINMQLEASKRIKNGATFGSNFADSFGMTIDTTKTKATTSLVAGAASITVESAEGLAPGLEVTVYDDVNIERVTISAINGNVLTVPALVKSFKKGTNVARTSAIVDADNRCAKFGGWSSTGVITVTDSTVATAGILDMSGNGGRRLIRLNTGELVAGFIDRSYVKIYRSDDNGRTFKQIFSESFTNVNGLSLATNGTLIYITNGESTTTIRNICINKNGGVVARYVVDTGLVATGSTSTAINDLGTEVYIAWAGKKYPRLNNWNIYYAKGIIDSKGTITWGSAETVTVVNGGITPVYHDFPSVVFDSKGEPHIINILFDGGQYYVQDHKKIDNGWFGTMILYGSGANNNQNGPIAIFVPKSINGLQNGAMWVAWAGKDSTEYVDNIRIAFSTDDGKSWTLEKITSGTDAQRRNASITVDKDNNIYVYYCTALSVNDKNSIYMKKYSGGAWGPEVLVSGGPGRKSNPSALFDVAIDASIPPFIYEDADTIYRVGFYGTFVAEVEAPLQENDIRFKIKDTDEVATWVQRDSGLNVSAALNGQTMDKTTVGNEDQFLKSLGSRGPVEIRLTMKRDKTTDDIKITKILGGVG